MATRHGARAPGLADEIGSVEPGKAADLVTHDLTRTESHPRLQDPVEALVDVMQSGTVGTVVVAGEIVIERGRSTRVHATEVHGTVDRFAAEVEGRMGPGRFSRWPLVH